jgi:hypothetical protein
MIYSPNISRVLTISRVQRTGHATMMIEIINTIQTFGEEIS